eukprot:403342574
MQTKTLSILLVSLLILGQTSATQLSSPRVKEYINFGEFNPMIQLVKFNAGASMGIYEGLLSRNIPQYRADGCYRDIWELADKIITSFSLIGRGPEQQFIALGIFLTQLGETTYRTVKTCLPLFQETPETYVAASEPTGLDLYVRNTARLMLSLYIFLYNTDEFVLGKGLAEVFFNIYNMISKVQ